MKMNFYAILGMTLMPKIESPTRKITQTPGCRSQLAMLKQEAHMRPKRPYLELSDTQVYEP